MLHKISKPHLVDLLRMSDHNRWLQPRIRYASVRSKPELIRDLEDHFLVKEHWESTPYRILSEKSELPN